MEQYINESDVRNYLILPNTFDWGLVDQEAGFLKVFDIFSEKIYNELKNSTGVDEKQVFKLITKSAVYYSFIFSIPKIKVYINNYGIDQFKDDKLTSAPWWDVRDLGISMLKIADKSLSDAITLAFSIDSIKSKIPFFKNTSGLISFPSEFQKIYPINYSTDVFIQLQKYLDQSLVLNISEFLNEDCLQLVKNNDLLVGYLTNANAFYALYYASQLPGIFFTQSSVVVQYEELPWQKSVILSESAKITAGQNFLQLANQNMKIIIDYIKKNKDSYPCYVDPSGSRKMLSRKSGIYL